MENSSYGAMGISIQRLGLKNSFRQPWFPIPSILNGCYHLPNLTSLPKKETYIVPYETSEFTYRLE